MSSLGTSMKRDIIATGQRIAQLFNASGILDIPITFQNIGEQSNMLAVRFSLNQDTYSEASYFIEQSGIYKGRLCASGIGVNSSIGYKTGTLLFHLTLFLAISRNAAVFYLDNFTDDPARAAQGIYELLDVDKTMARHGSARSEFTGLNREDQLHLAEGGMRLMIDRATLRRWKTKMATLAKNVQIENLPSPWAQPVEPKMRLILTQISQFAEFSGGRKIVRKRRFSQKTTKKSGKIRKKSKKKKQKRKSNFQF